MDNKPQNFVVPEDAVFERAPILGHDALLKPKTGNAMRLEGNGRAGDVVEYLHVDDTDGKFHHEMVQDVEPVLEYVKDQHSMYGTQAGKNKAGDFYHAARVPVVIIHAWLNARGLKMSDFKGDVVDRFLNDSENAAFRVWQGRV